MVVGMWAWWGLIACGPRFESPWEEARAIDQRVSGWARAAVDSELPGAGWFRTDGADGLEAHDFSWATVREVDGAAAAVVVVTIGGFGPSGTSVLEIDAALPAWVAGPLPVDGQASVAQLRTADGAEPFVVGGTIDVVAAGARPGEVVELSFADLALGEVP